MIDDLLRVDASDFEQPRPSGDELNPSPEIAPRVTAEASEPHSAAGSRDSMPQIIVRPISDGDGHWQTRKFLKAFVWPAFFVFLIPVGSFIFFHYAQHRVDADARERVLKQVSADKRLSPQERRTIAASLSEWRISELMRDGKIEVDAKTRFYWSTIHWAIVLSQWSILGGILVFVIAGLCVFLSRRSQSTLYLSLSLGWQLLRIYAATQTFIQGALLVALSFWITALFFDTYFPQLMAAASLIAVAACSMVVAAIFKPIPDSVPVRGKVFDRDGAVAVWNGLQPICQRLGVTPPDHLIAGIDDNFFVTESPVSVGGWTVRGRTLYVSLPLVKQLSGSEADAVLAHELAHFHGDDTLYAKKISPLLTRFEMYLQALANGGVTWPIFRFMCYFRVLYALALSQQSRDREFRADRLAARATSPTDVSAALLKIAAYTRFRHGTQQRLFEQTEPLSGARIREQVEDGFREYAKRSVGMAMLDDCRATHPFDDHPSLTDRLQALGVPIDPEHLQALLAAPGDGRWYYNFDKAEEIECRQWDEFERKFCSQHEQGLAFQLLPESEKEREIVAKWFPEVTFSGKRSSLALACDWIHFSEWPGRVYFREVTNLIFMDGWIYVDLTRDENVRVSFKLNALGKEKAAAYKALGEYYGRYRAALANLEKQDSDDTETGTDYSDQALSG